MLRMLWNKRAQNTAEYAILIGIVVAAAVAMQTYVKRNLQAGVKYAVDKAKAGDTGTGQYEPYYQESSFDTTTEQYKDTEEMKTGGEVERIYGADGQTKRTTRSGYQKQRATEP